MNERSYSLPKIATENSIKRQNSLRYLSPRLNFPQPGDSSIFSNAGRKHFENHTDRMLKIILPEKFAAERPIVLKRQISYPPPHLIRQSSDRVFEAKQNTRNEFGNLKKMFARDVPLREKIEDELDKMKRSMDIHIKQLPRVTVNDVGQMRPILQSKDQKSDLHKLSHIYPLTPAISVKKEPSPNYNGSQLLYNPENKEKYDAVLKGRWISPTNLSTGLSVI